MRQALTPSRPELETQVEVFLSERIRESLELLIDLRNPDGGWGRLKGAPSEVRHTAVAVGSLCACDYERYMAACEEGLQYIADAIRSLQRQQGQGISDRQLENLVLIADALASIKGTRYNDELEWCLSQIQSAQNPDGGWGKASSRMQETAIAARALSFLKAFSNGLSKAVSFLLHGQNDDGGWGVSQGFPSSVGITSQALQALIAGDHSPESVVVQNAIKFLTLNQNAEGSWSEGGEGNVYHTALCLLSLRDSEISIEEESVRRAVDFLANIKNDDHGWGWKADEASQTEPTAYALRALVAAGAKQYLPMAHVLVALAESHRETALLRQELTQIRSDLDARVREAIPAVVKDRDRLFEQLTELRSAYPRVRQESEQEIDRLRAGLDRLSSETNTRLGQLRELADKYSTSIAEAASRLWLNIRLLLFFWILYAVAMTGTAEVSPLPLWADIAAAVSAAVLIVISISAWRRYGRLELTRRRTHTEFQESFENALTISPEDLPDLDTRRRRDLDKSLIRVRRAFDILALVLREMPPSLRYELVMGLERSLEYRGELSSRELSRVLRYAQIPSALSREAEMVFFELSRSDIPRSVLFRELRRFQEQVL